MATAPDAAAPAAAPSGPLASMTAFARVTGRSGPWQFAWEVRSVNAKGLDVRLRVPQGLDALEAEARALAARHLSRGSVSATLTSQRDGEVVAVRINQAALAALISAARAAAEHLGTAPPSIDTLLQVKGIVEVSEAEDSEDERRAFTTAAAAAFETALKDLAAMRAREGGALRAVLQERLAAVSRLVSAAEALPERRLEAIKARLGEQVRALMEANGGLDPERLHQEAVLLATKADVREELDRLAAHLKAAGDLLADGGPVGRRLDFLAQEFNREANTLCSKSNSVQLTQIGLDLKLTVDQFREQIQNIE